MSSTRIGARRIYKEENASCNATLSNLSLDLIKRISTISASGKAFKTPKTSTFRAKTIILCWVWIFTPKLQHFVQFLIFILSHLFSLNFRAKITTFCWDWFFFQYEFSRQNYNILFNLNFRAKTITYSVWFFMVLFQFYFLFVVFFLVWIFAPKLQHFIQLLNFRAKIQISHIFYLFLPIGYTSQGGSKRTKKVGIQTLAFCGSE